jgi:peptidoglycan/LPS O-acetylase OafA/YrhL
MYVFAYPVEQTLVHLAGGRMSVARLVPLALLVTLVLAMISWRLIEAPALARKRGRPTDSPLPLVPVPVAPTS